MSYPRLILIRRPHIEGQPTQGSLMWETAPNILRHTMIRTLELEWKDNAKGESCIPAGSYPMRYTMSNRFKRMMWGVDDVPDRAGIRFHAGNYAGDKLSDSDGCILPVQQWSDINGDGVIDGTGSKKALEAFEGLLEPYREYGLTLDVRWAPR